MTLSKIEEYLRRCPPASERDALNDVVEGLGVSPHALYALNTASFTKLVKSEPNHEERTPDLFPV
jgi:hypothetical protein